jgi:hypothetical protein
LDVERRNTFVFFGEPTDPDNKGKEELYFVIPNRYNGDHIYRTASRQYMRKISRRLARAHRIQSLANWCDKKEGYESKVCHGKLTYHSARAATKAADNSVSRFATFTTGRAKMPWDNQTGISRSSRICAATNIGIAYLTA